jgi:multidrug resistance protein, MATE family
VLVGQAVGRGDPSGARRSGYTGFGLCGAITLVSGTTTYLFAEQITRAYTTDPAVAALTLALLEVAALLQIGDGIQVAAAFALRGLKDTRVPLMLNAATYWGVGFTLAYGLGLVWGYGAIGIWTGLTVALWTAGALLIGRYVVLTRRLVAGGAMQGIRGTQGQGPG